MGLGTKNKGFSKEQIEKIGNAIIYIAKEVSDLNKTKILKILFLFEEASIKKYGTPFFGINFQLWVRGPVAKDIFIDLSDDSPSMLKDYIKKEPENTFVSIKDFNDDEFSDNDVDIMNLVLDFAKQKKATTLVNHLHGKNSLWRKSAIKYGVLEQLLNEEVNNTDYEVDFSLLFEKNSYLLERFQDSVENNEFARQLKD
jgi:uncharacterized phage-associated protein